MPAKRRTARKKTRKSWKDPAARERALEALNRMRSDGFSLTRAARLAHTTPETVRKYVGQTLIRSPGGRYAATRSDRLTRRLWALTDNEKVEVPVRGSRLASLIAKHWVAVDRYLRTGEEDWLQAFSGQTFRAGNVTHQFLTDLDALDRLALAGEVSFDRLYVLRA
jgi:hypothetical protein